MKFNTPYKVPFKSNGNPHVILTGDITGHSLVKFLKEFYHPDHEINGDIKILII